MQDGTKGVAQAAPSFSVRLVSITKPLIEGLETGSDLIGYVARVSNPANQMNTSTYKKLIQYLIDNDHWSPLEMADATVEIITTRDIARQMLRHRSFKFQEFSQRYAQAESFQVKEARRQDLKNRQNSIDDIPKQMKCDWYFKQEELIRQAQETYKWALDNGIAKECARVVLPEGLTETTLYMKGDYRSWLHYLKLREDVSTQLEHKEIANKIHCVLAEHEELFR